MIEVGQRYIANNQGIAITPQSLSVTVVWIDGDHVHYRVDNQTEIKQTPLQRFLEIIGERQ